jgi:DNA recombination-mediator protein A
MVGSRASTAYGNHVCAEMAAALAERGWAVISGGPEGSHSQAALTLGARLPGVRIHLLWVPTSGFSAGTGSAA